MSLEDDLNAIADQADARRDDPFAAPNQSDEQTRPGIKPWLRRTLCRELAIGEQTRAALARKYGVARSTMTEFAQRHAAEIDAIKADLDNEFAGLWVAQKGARIAAYQADIEASLTGPYAGHYEHMRTRQAALRAISEELGQLPPRATVAVVPVQHILDGVDVDQLK